MYKIGSVPGDEALNNLSSQRHDLSAENAVDAQIHFKMLFYGPGPFATSLTPNLKVNVMLNKLFNVMDRIMQQQ